MVFYKKKGQQYRWLFISDLQLTGSPEKLRWSSIQKLSLYDGLLILEQSLPPMRDNRFFIIDPISAKCARIKEDQSNTWQAQTEFASEADQPVKNWLDYKKAFESFKTN